MSPLLRVLALAWLAYVLPGDRVVGMLAETRASRTPLHVEARLSARDSKAPTSLVIELHPDLGARVWDEKGGRWLLAGGKATAGTVLPAPAWVPDLAPLVMRRESELRGWLGSEGVDAQQNDLARCGDGDCWVLGGRAGSGQLWIQKPALELRRLVQGKVTRASYDDWQAFGKIRFPKRIELADDSGSVATLTVDSVSAITLGAAELSPGWVQASPAAKAR
ncbi:MAG TPA: hypothetical protein VMR86_09045 [Myxococcota bacterium]|nr:hypothetical protein [Myxococcota bacterium]